MKKSIVALLFVSSFGFASEYYSKLNPVSTYIVKSAVSGKIMYANNDLEAKEAKKSTIIRIDANIEREDLKQSKIKLQNLQETLRIEEGTLKSFEKVSSKSKFDKDNQRIKILGIASSISDLKTKIATLEDTLAKKVLNEKDGYIYDVAVEEGDYVTPGTVLYTRMDLSAGKLEFFVPIAIADTLDSKTIYLDGKKTDLKISKLFTIADTTHISSYKCEIEVPQPTGFSHLVKIEFK